MTSALDQLVAEGILRLLDRLQEELDLATVRSIADEVIVMKEGRVVEMGPKDVMFTPPHHPYTDLLLSSVPEMDPNWLNTVLEERGAYPAWRPRPDSPIGRLRADVPEIASRRPVHPGSMSS